MAILLFLLIYTFLTAGAIWQLVSFYTLLYFYTCPVILSSRLLPST
ncbi:hypothetical protein [Pontibacter chinhatensis]|nr:hypothetical protein [Pontibacter chinhatensis]